MALFLKIVAAFFVAICIFVVALIWFVKVKLRSFAGDLMKQVMAAATPTVPPFRMKIRPVDSEDIEWSNETELNRLSEEFEVAGFEQISDYQTDDAPVALRAFYHPEQNSYGVIYEHPAAGYWCDVTRRYTDESSWTITSTKEHGMDSPPSSRVVFMPQEPIAVLFEKLLEVSPVNNIEPCSAEGFQKRFETGYAKEMNWQIDRGGPTEQEIRRIAEINGQECDQQMVDTIQEQWKSAIADFLSERVIQMWKKENPDSADERAGIQHRVTVVHNRSTSQQLMNAVFPDFCMDDLDELDADDFDLDDPDDRQEFEQLERRKALMQQLKMDLRAGSVRSAFEKLLTSAGVADQWKKLGEVARPINSDLWLQPEFIDDDDDEDSEDDEFEDDLDLDDE